MPATKGTKTTILFCKFSSFCTLLFINYKQHLINGQQAPGWLRYHGGRGNKEGQVFPEPKFKFVKIEQNDINVQKISLKKANSKIEAEIQHRRARNDETDNNAEVVIVGAGAAGMGCAYRLSSSIGIRNVVILEGSNKLGGRMQVDKDFQNYPLDLGPSFLPGSWFQSELERLAKRSLQTTSPPGAGMVWKNYSYNDYFTEHIAPKLDIRYNCNVTQIDYSGKRKDDDNVRVDCEDGRMFHSPYVIVTANIKVLQDEDISFIPKLDPSVYYHRDWWPGFKIFLEYSDTEKFYYEAFCPQGGECYNETGEELFWDYTVSAPDPNNAPNLLSGYIAGDRINDFGFQPKGIKNNVEVLIQQYFGLQERLNAKSYLLQDWRKKPFIKGFLAGPAKDSNYDDNGSVLINLKPTLILAGDSYPIRNDEWGWVYGALHSGFDAAETISSMMFGSKSWETLVFEDFEDYDDSSSGFWTISDSTQSELVKEWNGCPDTNCFRFSNSKLRLLSDIIDVTQYTLVQLSYELSYTVDFGEEELFLVEWKQESSSRWQTIEQQEGSAAKERKYVEKKSNKFVIILDTSSISGNIEIQFNYVKNNGVHQIFLDNIFLGYSTASSKVTIDKENYQYGENIKVSFNIDSPKLGDWVEICAFDNDSILTSDYDIKSCDSDIWLFTCGSSTDCETESLPSKGELVFNSAVLKSGTYIVFLNCCFSYDLVAASTTFTISSSMDGLNSSYPIIFPTPTPAKEMPPAIVLSTNKAVYTSGEIIQVTFFNNSPEIDDWVEICSFENSIDQFSRNDMISCDSDTWMFTCGNTESCENTISSDILGFDSTRLDPGKYVAFLNCCDSYEVVAASIDFTIIADNNNPVPVEIPPPALFKPTNSPVKQTPIPSFETQDPTESPLVSESPTFTSSQFTPSPNIVAIVPVNIRPNPTIQPKAPVKTSLSPTFATVSSESPTLFPVETPNNSTLAPVFPIKPPFVSMPTQNKETTSPMSIAPQPTMETMTPSKPSLSPTILTTRSANPSLVPVKIPNNSTPTPVYFVDIPDSSTSSPTINSSGSALEPSIEEISSPSPISQDEYTICFPGESIVEIRGKGLIEMKDLKIGDEVKSTNYGGIHDMYQTVYSFGHYNPQQIGEFIELSISNVLVDEYGTNKSNDEYNQFSKSSIMISKNHLILTPRGDFVPAGILKIGDLLVNAKGKNYQSLNHPQVVVSDIKYTTRKGVYAPFTFSGTLVVNGIIVSSYATLQKDNHWVMIGNTEYKVPILSAHFAGYLFESIHRVAYRMGIGAETYIADGISTWVNIPHKFFHAILNNKFPAIVQFFVLVPCVSMISVVFFVEKICFFDTISSVSLLIVAVVSAVLWFSRKKSQYINQQQR